MKHNHLPKLKKKSPLTANVLLELDSIRSKKPPKIEHCTADPFLVDLGSLKLYELNESQVQSTDLFMPALYFIDVDNPLPGAISVQLEQPLLYNGNAITPLLPFSPLLLECFTPKELVERIQFFQNEQFVEVSITLPLFGTDGETRDCKLAKKYVLEESQAIEDVPVLELWPHIKVEGWQDYYAFYLDCNDTFQVSFNEVQEPHTYSDRNGNYMITHLSSFPSHINCQRQGYPIGFILLKTPLEQKLTDSWRVGVDFGTSFTNVYVNHKGKIKSLQLESLHLKVTGANVETRQPVLFENFIPEIFVPTDKPLPLANVFTRLGETGNESKKVLYDGRIYVPDRINFHPESNWIETSFAWNKPDISKLFLEHLALIVSALAAKTEVKKIEWVIAYPSIRTKVEIKLYLRLWQEIINGLNATTSIQHHCPAIDDQRYLRSNSLAFAQYFRDQEDCALIRAVCINFEPDHTDISVWQDNHIIHQVSLNLSRLSLLDDLLLQRSALVAKWFKRPEEEWTNLADDKFKAKIDSLLRYESERWLKDERPELKDDKDFQGLIQLMAIGTAGLYYYIGLIMRTLAAEKKYKEPKIPSVYIGGHGSHLFHWLTTEGVFTKNSGISDLFRRILANASGLKEASTSSTRISQRPQDEIAFGLVSSKSRLHGLEHNIKNSMIAGENCRINGQNVGFDQRMEAGGDDISSIEAPATLDRLVDFINSFNEGIKDLEIEEEIKPFTQYRRGSGLEASYADALMDKTMTELRSTLINNGDRERLRVEPPFILGLKALMRVLAKEWAGK